MTTLALNPQAEAQELHAILEDFRELLKIRMKRKDATPTRVVVIGKLLNHFDELEALNCHHEEHPETEVASREAAVGA